MKKKLLTLAALFLAVLTPLPAKADVNSCTQKVIQAELSNGPHVFEKGKVIATETYQGMNYHLIFLDGGWKEVELIIMENAQTCKKLLYNPTAEPIEYATLMPTPVASKLTQKLAAYSKAKWESRQKEEPFQ